MSDLQVINLWAGPGAGKSTTAAGLFFKMKTKGYKVELVTEYAKDLTYERNWDLRRDQLAVTAEQIRRQRRLIGNVDYCITDSPILLGIHYGRNDPHLSALVLGEWGRYVNANFFVRRVKPYQPWGRREDEGSARKVDEELKALMKREQIMHWDVDGDEHAPDRIMSFLFGV